MGSQSVPAGAPQSGQGSNTVTQDHLLVVVTWGLRSWGVALPSGFSMADTAPLCKPGFAIRGVVWDTGRAGGSDPGRKEGPVTTTKARYETAWRTAVEAATAAEAAVKPPRFNVVERKNPLDDTSPVTRFYDNGGQGYEDEGTALVKLSGVSGFGRWLKANAADLRVTQTDWYSGRTAVKAPYVSQSDYYRGLLLGTPPRGYTRSVTWAAAFAAALNELEPKAKATYLPFMD